MTAHLGRHAYSLAFEPPPAKDVSRWHALVPAPAGLALGSYASRRPSNTPPTTRAMTAYAPSSAKLAQGPNGSSPWY